MEFESSKEFKARMAASRVYYARKEKENKEKNKDD